MTTSTNGIEMLATRNVSPRGWDSVKLSKGETFRVPEDVSQQIADALIGGKFAKAVTIAPPAAPKPAAKDAGAAPENKAAAAKTTDLGKAGATAGSKS